MKKCILFFIVVSNALSCDDGGEVKTFAELPPAEYEGTFYRWSVYDLHPEKASVRLSLGAGTFSGESSMPRYPAVCRGGYVISGNQVEFSDQCFWTAEFDWTFILSGKFDISPLGRNSIMLSKEVGNAEDVYKLKRISAATQ